MFQASRVNPWRARPILFSMSGEIQEQMIVTIATIYTCIHELVHVC